MGIWLNLTRCSMALVALGPIASIPVFSQFQHPRKHSNCLQDEGRHCLAVTLPPHRDIVALEKSNGLAWAGAYVSKD